jgi:Zn-dependent protease
VLFWPKTMHEYLELAIFLPLFLLTVSVHEYSHGWVASKLGDDTARERRRLTLNPLAHISVPLTIVLPILVLLVTWGRFALALLKPVPINPLRFRNPKRGLTYVGIAGPVSNLLMALMLSLLLRFGILPHTGLLGSLRDILGLIIIVNIILALFNLLPIPPLDGSRVLVGLLPNKYARAVLRLDRYGFIFILTLFISLALISGGILQFMMIPLKFVWKLYGLSGVEFDNLVLGLGRT